jgi:hypothetical protein
VLVILALIEITTTRTIGVTVVRIMRIKMEHKITMEPSKINSIVGTEDLLPDEVEKIEKQNWLRKQVDYKVMVKLGKKDVWEDFTGLFLMKDGWDRNKVTQHIKQFFSTDQFRPYTFGLFKRFYHNTTNNVNNNFKFQYQNNIKLLDIDLPLD